MKVSWNRETTGDHPILRFFVGSFHLELCLGVSLLDRDLPGLDPVQSRRSSIKESVSHRWQTRGWQVDPQGIRVSLDRSVRGRESIGFPVDGSRMPIPRLPWRTSSRNGDSKQAAGDARETGAPTRAEVEHHSGRSSGARIRATRT